jgi:hypothetical protein
MAVTTLEATRLGSSTEVSESSCGTWFVGAVQCLRSRSPIFLHIPHAVTDTLNTSYLKQTYPQTASKKIRGVKRNLMEEDGKGRDADRALKGKDGKDGKDGEDGQDGQDPKDRALMKGDKGTKKDGNERALKKGVKKDGTKKDGNERALSCAEERCQEG